MLPYAHPNGKILWIYTGFTPVERSRAWFGWERQLRVHVAPDDEGPGRQLRHRGVDVAGAETSTTWKVADYLLRVQQNSVRFAMLTNVVYVWFGWGHELCAAHDFAQIPRVRVESNPGSRRAGLETHHHCIILSS